jgi:hypothetical protein
MVVVDVSEERRRRRRAGDPRLSAAGREVLARITTGDLVDEFQAALDAYLEADRFSAATTTTPTDRTGNNRR